MRAPNARAGALRARIATLERHIISLVFAGAGCERPIPHTRTPSIPLAPSVPRAPSLRRVGLVTCQDLYLAARLRPPEDRT